MRRELLVIASMFAGSFFEWTGRGSARNLRRRPARAGAPIDLTGYWVSIVTQDWRWRMVTRRKATTRAFS